MRRALDLGITYFDTLQLHEADMHHWRSDDTAHRGRIQPDRDYAFDDTPARSPSSTKKCSPYSPYSPGFAIQALHQHVQS